MKSIAELKEEAQKWCNRYARLRDCLEYCKRMRIDVSQFSSYKNLPVKCCSCGAPRRYETIEPGHYFDKKMGGSSGVCLDERNINGQCSICNTFLNGNKKRYKDFMLKKYGQKVLDELQMKHYQDSYSESELKILAKLYKKKFEKLKNGIF